ncbi:hypothetical protein [Hyphococcus sp.]|uniref:hypothetical protein n=1 Tax=Hyphococcus sp. TaxID=2038636 RepID=UPI0035C69C96
MMRANLLMILAAAALSGGCQTVSTKTPAVLTQDDAQTLDQVKSVLAAALGRASIDLGPGDLTESSVISVLPPPLASREDRSLARPVIFDIMMSGKACYAVRRDTGDAYELGVPCKSTR